MSCYRKIIHSYKETVSLTSTKAWDLICSMKCLFDNLEETDKEKFWEVMKDIHEDIKGKHFDEVYAEYEVSDMYSTNIRGVVVRGEVISFKEAEKVYENYKRFFKQPANVWDVYVALNAQYHDYYTLYYEWLDGDEAKVHEKIILSAITFWFKDEDAKEGKVWDYFND